MLFLPKLSGNGNWRRLPEDTHHTRMGSAPGDPGWEPVVKEIVRTLAEEIGPRPPGSHAELKAAEYLAQQFRNRGIPAEIQSFAGPSHMATTSRLKQKGADEVFESLPAQFSPGGKREGDLVFLGDGEDPILPLKDLSGKIGLLIGLGNLHLRNRNVLTMEDKGLLGLIVAGPYFETIEAKIVRTPELEKMPVVCVSLKTARELQKILSSRVEMDVKTEALTRGESQNVVGVLNGEGKDWLVVEAHYDTAPYCPGAVDNASGVAVLIELISLLMRRTRPKTTVYFLATGSEEYGGSDGVGRFGDDAFLKQHKDELAHCIAYADIDGIGDALGIPHVEIGGSEAFRKALSEVVDTDTYRISNPHFRIADKYGGARVRPRK